MKKVVRNTINLNVLECLKGIGYKETKKNQPTKQQAGETVTEMWYYRWDNQEAGQAECDFKLTPWVCEHSDDQVEKG